MLGNNITSSQKHGILLDLVVCQIRSCITAQEASETIGTVYKIDTNENLMLAQGTLLSALW